MQEVAERLRHLREGVKLSQMKMAEVVGVKQSSLNRYELNQASPTFETLLRYADYFDLWHKVREKIMQPDCKEICTLY